MPGYRFTTGLVRKMSTASGVLVMLLVLSTSMASAASDARSPSHPAVSENGTTTGMDMTAVNNFHPALQREKEQLVKEFEASQSGTLSYSLFMQHLLAFEQKTGVHGSNQVALPSAVATPAYCIPSCNTNATDADVYTTFQMQPNTYYCGPATVSMMLYSLAHGLSQATLAGWGYLKTDSLQQTPWIYTTNPLYEPVGFTLSLVLSGSPTSGYYSQVARPSAATEKSDMKFDNVYGFPLALNTVEYNGSGYHLPGHPTSGYWYSWGPIGHWVDNNGFHNSGWTVHYADPATYFNRYSGWNVQQFNDVNLTDINTLLQTNGMVW